MKNLKSLENEIIAVMMEKNIDQSSRIHAELVLRGKDVSLVTVKRTLSRMSRDGFLQSGGAGRSTVYRVSSMGRTWYDVDARSYCAIEPDRRYGLDHYNFGYFKDFPFEIFNEREVHILKEATTRYHARGKHTSETLQQKELERLVIELSWKSSRIEGNTYTFLDTEKLILENKEASGHSHSEAQMILNHKEAFLFLYQNAALFKNVTRAHIEELHSILIKNLGVGRGLRKGAVGVTGSIYRPLDNQHQIREAVEVLAAATGRIKSPYAKALLVLAGLSYIQPFEDGNKRTARLLANAILLAYRCAPLSYRSVDENEYREATLVFYELNSLIPFKKIFIEQYLFAADHYALK